MSKLGKSVRMTLIAMLAILVFDHLFCESLVANFPSWAHLALAKPDAHYGNMITMSGVAAAFVLTFISVQGSLPSTGRILRRQTTKYLQGFEPKLEQIDEDSNLTQQDINTIKRWLRESRTSVEDIDESAEIKEGGHTKNQLSLLLEELDFSMLLETRIDEPKKDLDRSKDLLRRLGFSRISSVYMHHVGLMPALERAILIYLLILCSLILISASLCYVMFVWGGPSVSLIPFLAYATGTIVSILAVGAFAARIWPISDTGKRFAPLVEHLKAAAAKTGDDLIAAME